MQKAENKPNILIFMTDQQRGKSIAPYHEAITPNIDRFCKEGVTFSKAYTVAPHCCPSRASFFAGLYPSEHGVWNNIGVGNTLSKGLYSGVKLFSEDLQEAGYTTLFSGKWHVSCYDSPKDRGFSHLSDPNRYPTEPLTHKTPSQKRWKDYEYCEPPHRRKEGELYREGYPNYIHYGSNKNPYNDTTTVEEAIKLFKQRALPDTPWCHYIGTIGPHDPYCPPQRFLDMYQIEDITLPKNFYDDLQDKPNLYRRTQDRFDQLTEQEHKEAIRHYLAYCSYEDELFGQVLEALEASGQVDNTLVLFTSDHGDYMGEHGLWCKGLPCFLGGYHIPAVIRWPKGIQKPNRVVDDMIAITDFAPTLLEASGISVSQSFSGKSLMDYLQNTQRIPIHTAHHTQTNGNELYGIQRSVMTRKWKYVYNGFDYDELYNMQDDPEELHNLAKDPAYRSVIRGLAKQLWQFAKNHKDVCINPYIMVSLAEYGPGLIYENSTGDDYE